MLFVSQASPRSRRPARQYASSAIELTIHPLPPPPQWSLTPRLRSRVYAVGMTIESDFYATDAGRQHFRCVGGHIVQCTHPPTHPLPLTMRFVCVIAATNSRRSAVSSRPSNLPPNTAQLRCSLDHHLYSQIASRRCDYIIAQTPPDSDHPPCLCAFWR